VTEGKTVMRRFVLVMRPMPFGHGAFLILHGAFWFWSWGVLPPHREAKSCAKLSKQISGSNRPTRLTRPTRPTSPSAKREAQSLALHCSLQSAKLCEMGLCAPCRGASAVVLRFSCQRSNWLIPLPLSKCASTPSKLA